MNKEISKLQLLVTEVCNLRCTYCPIKKQPVHMTWKIAKKAIDVHFKDFNPDIWYLVEFFGGEPMVKFDLVKRVIEYVKTYEQKYNIRVSYRMVTNGTLVDEKFVEFMKDNPYFYIKLSCDGIQEAHDLHRKTAAGKNSFYLVEKALNLFKENDLFQGKRVQVGSVSSPDTVKYIYKNYKFFTDFDENLSFDYNLAYNLKWLKRDWIEFEKQQELIIEEEKKKILKGQKCRDAGVSDFIKKIVTDDFSSYECQAGRRKGMAISPQGDIFICPYFESFLRDEKLSKQKDKFYLGNIMDYEKIDRMKWDKNKCKVSHLMKTVTYKECEQCKNKKYCYWTKCIGANYVKHKSLFKLNTNQCKTLDHYLRPTLKFHSWLKEKNLLDQYIRSFDPTWNQGESVKVAPVVLKVGKRND